jgi:predicted TIM-barrel fold metal-dependent hydrolase
VSDEARDQDVIDGWINMPVFTREEIVSDPALMKHLGFFGHGPEVFMEHSLDELIADMDAVQVGRGLLTGTPMSRNGSGMWGAASIDAARAVEYCRASDGRLRLGLQLDGLDRLTRITRQLRELAAAGDLALVRVIPSALEVPIDDRLLYHVYGTCEEIGVPVSVNVGVFGPLKSSKYQDPLLLEDVLIDFPDLTVIGAHMGHPWEQLMIRLMMKHENLYLMTSAFSPKYIAAEVVSFMNSSRGRHKVMWASEWPILTFTKMLSEARQLPLSKESQDAYLGGNLARILDWPLVSGLRPPSAPNELRAGDASAQLVRSALFPAVGEHRARGGHAVPRNCSG